MSKREKLCKNCILLTVFAVLSTLYPSNLYAENKSTGAKIIVSLGDSYSSGEGIEPFYGQEKDLEDKVKDEDWLAHRSEKSWPGLLTLHDLDGKMADYKDTYWYFKAISGATTDNLKYKITKEYDKGGSLIPIGNIIKRFGNTKGEVNLSPELDVFDELGDNAADFITITIGGNDVDFTGIIKKCMLEISFININGLNEKFRKTWDDFSAKGGTKDKILDAYKTIQERAGDEANIIVVGYPKLLSREKRNFTGLFFSKSEINEVNSNVSQFNRALETIVKNCRDDGMNICFVSVEDEFSGHEAYSNEPYINEVILGTRSQDLKTWQLSSQYSVHPNEEGAKAYARCVQAKIDEIEGDEEQDQSHDQEKQEDKLSDKISQNVEEKQKEIANEVSSWFKKQVEKKIKRFMKKSCKGCY